MPASFFIALGIVAILFTQRTVRTELETLGEKNLRQVRDGLELIFSEADSLALSVSTDPEFTSSLIHSLQAGFRTLPDLKVSRSLQSTLASAVNSRRYLHSITANTPDSPGLVMSSAEGPLRIDASMDPDWLAGTEDHAGSLGPWTRIRDIRPFPSLSLRIPVLSFYRNLLGSGTLARLGVLCVNVDLRYLGRLLSAQAAGGDGQYILADRAGGKVIAGMSCSDDEIATLLASVESGEARPGSRSRDLKPATIGGKSFLVASSISARFPFAYFLVIPESAFTRVTKRIGLITFVFALVALAFGTVLVLSMTRRNFRLVNGIMDIIDAAGSGRELPDFRESPNEDLDFVTFSVLKTFVEHDYFMVRLREREYRQSTLELTALQAQMNPHFLFNTLTTIGFKAMAMSSGQNDLTRMVELLSGILRYALSDPGNPVTIGDEVAHTRKYCEIQAMRFGPGFRHEWQIDEALEGLPCLKLMIQPLVENALEHGFGGGAVSGLVDISVSRDGDLVAVSVRDDGEGITDEAILAIESRVADENPAPEHLGLANTIKRLILTYGEGASYSMARGEASGTVITLRFPARPIPVISATPGDSGQNTPGRPG